MRFFTKIAAIIYRSYDDRGVDIPHFRMIITIVFILFIHAVHIGLIFDLPSDYIMPWSSDTSRPLQWLFGFIYFGILITIILLLFKKSKLDKVEVSQKQIDRGRNILPIYLVLCIVLLVALLIKSGIERGKINF
jgi:hypothetical protein